MRNYKSNKNNNKAVFFVVTVIVALVFWVVWKEPQVEVKEVSKPIENTFAK